MKQLTLPISPLLPNHVVVSLALTLSFIASANAEDDPRITISSENVKASEYAVVRLRKGLQIEGKVIRLSKDSLTISHKRLGKTVPASNPLETIAAIQLGEFVYWRAANGSFHSERAAEWHRRGVVTVVNNTDEDVTFTITSIKNPDAVVEDLEEESPTGISLFLQRPRQSAVAWKLRQGERTRLSYQGLDVITSHIMYSLKTSNGTTRTGATNSDGRAGFVVEIKPSDLHSPLLVDLGDWHVEQDAYYTNERGTTPLTGSSKVDSWDKKKTNYTFQGGDSYEYKVEHLAGTATAWASISNSTRSRIKVHIVVDWLFAGFGTPQRVETSLRLGPSVESKVYLSVNTSGLFGNKRAASIKLVDIVTTRE